MYLQRMRSLIAYYLRIRCNFGRVTSIADIGTLSRDAIWYGYGLYPFTCRCGVEVAFQFQAKAVAVFIDGYSKI